MVYNRLEISLYCSVFRKDLVMGYTTVFTGSLDFVGDISRSRLSYLKNNILGHACRDHPEWEGAKGLYYIDLELLDNFKGIQWNGAEKVYDMDKLVNVVIRQMRQRFPDFKLQGIMYAQGEDFDDKWELVINNDGWAVKEKSKITGEAARCPHCGKKFELK